MDSTITIALMGNCTTKYLANALTNECEKYSIPVNIYDSPFNQYNQELLDTSSGFYRSKPDVVIILLEGEILMSAWYNINQLQEDEDTKHKLIEDAYGSVISVITKLIENTESKIIFNNFKVSYYSPLGIFDNKTRLGLKAMLTQLNLKLEEWALDKKHVYIFDYNGLCSSYGHLRSTDPKLYYSTKSPFSISFSKALAREYMRYILPLMSKNKKCLVLDLDNTLWGGVAGEDGISGIKLDIDGPAKSFYDFQKEILNLYNKGIILAINSKNNLQDAMEIIENHPHMLLRRKHFAAMRINWEDKVTNLKEIARELNIGIDSLVFFDDNPVERGLVKSLLPQVGVVEVPEDTSKYAQALRDIVDFELLAITSEDIKRNQMYEDNQKRLEAKQQYSSLEEYLQSLETKIFIEPANSFTVSRVAQLTQKTNQFNMTTKRYQTSDIEDMLKSRQCLVYTCQVTDKFGDNGLVGVCIIKIESDNAYIDSLLFSCRVLGRNIEYAFLSAIARWLFQNGIKTLHSRFIPTEKNTSNRDFYSLSGFELKHEEESERLFVLKSIEKLRSYDYIEIYFKDIPE